LVCAHTCIERIAARVGAELLDLTAINDKNEERRRKRATSMSRTIAVMADRSAVAQTANIPN
jgi:hypothetical protein